MGMVDNDVLVRLLDAESHRYRAVANNLANVETPGYRTVRVGFAQELDRVLDETGRVREGREISTEVFRPMFPDASADGNDVSLEREIVELNKNQLRMRVYLNVLGSKVRRLRAAIDGR